MRRPWQIWLAFSVCLTVAMAGVSWLSYRALEADRAEEVALARASLEENARLALWRIDSAVASLIASENAQPYSAYQSFHAVNHRVAPNSKKSVRAGQKTAERDWVASPLLTENNPRVRLHFEFDATGKAFSPGVPPEELLDRAVPRLLSAAALSRRRQLLEELTAKVNAGSLLAQLPPADLLVASAPPNAGPPRIDVLATDEPPPQGTYPQQGNYLVKQQANLQQQAAAQDLRNAADFSARSQAVAANTAVQQAVRVADSPPPDRLPSEVQTAVVTPVWADGELLLVRRVRVDGADRLQGCWLDWPLLRDELLATVRDLLPRAELVPADNANEPTRTHQMAALPVTLLPGSLESVASAGGSLADLSPLKMSLVITWIAAGLAALAVALLLAGVISLSERRAAFVSAVTHELRTPLTTFRMYAEMLAEGMVPDEASRRSYLETLRVEADRLTHLVENVLAYAKLERGGPGARIAPVSVANLLERATDRLTARAGQAGFALQVTAADHLLSGRVIADPAAVEQILFNLVDNACKYARTANNRLLELEVSRSANRVFLRLRDYGPGIADRERKRLFQPFHKSAHDAASSAPGVGLGLTLCLRLARDMGGDLQLERAHSCPGACFALSLRAAD